MTTITDQVLVHIGYHKTGTSWLQQELFVHGNEWFEPVSDRDNLPSLFGRLFFMNKEGYWLSPFSFDKAYVVGEYRRLSQRENRDFVNKTPVISHERLCGAPNSAGFDARDIAHRIKEVLPNARCLIVLREQKSMYFSNYYNYLATGGALSLQRYLKTEYDRRAPGFSPDHFNYLPLIQEYYQLFGKENVLVLPYEMFAKSPELFFDALGNLVGKKITIDREKLAVRRNEKTNKYISYRWRFTNFLSVKNSLTGYSPFASATGARGVKLLKSMLGKLIPKSAEEKLLRTQKASIDKYIGDRYFEKNREISRLIGIDLSKYGYH